MRVRRGGVAVGVAVLASGCAAVRHAIEPRSATLPVPAARGSVQSGIASWYGPGFHGRRTANGEVFDQHELTAAHRTLRHGTRVLVTNLRNGRGVEVRINDRGPFVGGRVIDLSYAAARTIDMIGPGTAPVRLEILGDAGGGPPRIPRTAPALVPPAPPTLLDDTRWTVEVATLTDGARAEHLRGVLARHFADAFVLSLDGDAGRYYRVRIGPYPRRTNAQASAERVARLGYPAILVEETRP